MSKSQVSILSKLAYSQIFPRQIRADLSVAAQAAGGASGLTPQGEPTRNADDGSQAADQSVILLVSEDDFLRSVMRSFLDHAGFLVRCCADSGRASDLFYRRPLVDLLLIDVDGLGSSGVRLAARLTTISPDLRVVIMSEMMSEQLAFSGRSWGKWRFIRKPVSPIELLEIVQLNTESEEIRDGGSEEIASEAMAQLRRKVQ